ncbi:MAG: 50S ribosomal protein L3 [Candidatus Magasanikbacteria bacterium]|nr:50S ribosomal protein L3 [Candidatus Magasanikbacteria bacterium]
MKFILGKKIQMSQIFKENGDVVPVTIVEAGPCFVTQVKKDTGTGRPGIQIGFESVETKHLSKPKLGHLKDLPSLKFLKEFSLKMGEEVKINRGDEITVESFKLGDIVEVIGTSKGKGFQGVVKRHHFSGGPATHGHKDNLRMPGDIGAGGVQRVFKDQRMAGRMGGDQITIKNLEIAAIDAEKNILKIKGALPGARNGLLIIVGEGELTVKKKVEPVVVAPVEAAVAPEPVIMPVEEKAKV